MSVLDINFWVVFLMVLDIVLVVLMLFFVRSMKSGLRKEAAREASRELMGMIEPLIKETQVVARTFEAQLTEKKQLIHHLNEELDRRTASLNLLLNRAKAVTTSSRDKSLSAGPMYEQHDAILDLYSQNYDAETIAQKLSMPRGEVDLVIDLKRKFNSTG